MNNRDDLENEDLENFEEASKIYDELIRRNQENASYFEHIIVAKKITEVNFETCLCQSTC